MGGRGSGRKPSEKSIIEKFTTQPKQEIGTGMFLPNHSGISHHKEWENNLANHPHQDVTTTADPTFSDLTINKNIIVKDNASIGLLGGGSIQFDDQSTDEINFKDCNVGIGTDTPDCLLQVTQSGGNTNIHFDAFDVGAGETILKIRKSNTDTIGSTVATANGEVLGRIELQGVNSTPDWAHGFTIIATQNGVGGVEVPTDVEFATYSDTAKNDNQFVLSHDNSVGIGTGTPDGKLNIATSNTYNQVNIDSFDNGNKYAWFKLRKSDNDTIGTLSRTDDGDIIGDFTFQGVDAVPSFEEGAHIKVTQVGDTSTYVPTKMVISTFSSTAENTDQLVLYPDGNVGIGASTPSKKLDVNGDISLEAGSGDYYSNDGSQGWTGTFTNGDGATVTVKNGIITDVS